MMTSYQLLDVMFTKCDSLTGSSYFGERQEQNENMRFTGVFKVIFKKKLCKLTN